MDIFLIILLFIVGLILIVRGGDFFVDSASWIAKVSGVPKFIIGATIVSVATTLPEIMVSATAAFQGQVEMALGNSIGSVIANLGLIMGLSIFIIPISMKKEGYVSKVLILFSTAALVLILSILDFINIFSGIVLLVIFIIFLFENIRSGKKERDTSVEDKPIVNKKTISINTLKFIIGVVGIIIGSKLLIDNATKLAIVLNVPERVIAITTVALGTSLPELATAISAIKKRETALSIGNIIGANIINLTIVLPLTAFIYGGSIPLNVRNSIIDFSVALALILLAGLPILFKEKFKKWHGLALILIYASYTIFVIVGI